MSSDLTRLSCHGFLHIYVAQRCCPRDRLPDAGCAITSREQTSNSRVNFYIDQLEAKMSLFSAAVAVLSIRATKSPKQPPFTGHTMLRPILKKPDVRRMTPTKN